MMTFEFLASGTGLLRLRSGLTVESSEEELAVLVLKQEGLFFSAFNSLDQEATPFGVAENRHPGHLWHNNADGLAARLLCKFRDEFLRKGMEEDRAATLAVAYHSVQGLAPSHPVVSLACCPDTHVRDDRF